MIFNIQQTIQINMIKIGSINNSSVVQIGSAGIIKAYAALANTGGYTEVEPKPGAPFVPFSRHSPIPNPLHTLS